MRVQKLKEFYKIEKYLLTVKQRNLTETLSQETETTETLPKDISSEPQNNTASMERKDFFNVTTPTEFNYP